MYDYAYEFPTRTNLVPVRIPYACKFRKRTNSIRVRILYAYEFRTRTNFVRDFTLIQNLNPEMPLSAFSEGNGYVYFVLL